MNKYQRMTTEQLHLVKHDIKTDLELHESIKADSRLFSRKVAFKDAQTNIRKLKKEMKAVKNEIKKRQRTLF